MSDKHHPPLICQLTSRHSFRDERILHRMARTAAENGYRSAIAAPARIGSAWGAVTLAAVCPPPDGRLARCAVPFRLLAWALRSGGAVFHFHDPDLLLAGLALKCLGRRVIYDVHEDYEADMRDRTAGLGAAGRFVAKAWWAFESLVSRAFDGLVVTDRHVAGKFARHRPIVLGNYPRLSFTRASDATRETTFNILYVGDVSRERGLEAALDALALLPQADIRLQVVGPCDDPALLARMRSDARVCLHGFVSWDQLSAFYEKAHVGIALYQPLEGFLYFPGENAVKLIEYMAAGIPVLCSDFPGLKAFVEKPGYGLTAKPDDPVAIAAKLAELYSQPGQRARMGKNAREAFVREFHWEKHESKLLALYARILHPVSARP